LREEEAPPLLRLVGKASKWRATTHKQKTLSNDLAREGGGSGGRRVFFANFAKGIVKTRGNQMLTSKVKFEKKKSCGLAYLPAQGRDQQQRGGEIKKRKGGRGSKEKKPKKRALCRRMKGNERLVFPTQEGC